MNGVHNFSTNPITMNLHPNRFTILSSTNLTWILALSLQIYSDASKRDDYCSAAFYSLQYVGIQGQFNLSNSTLVYSAEFSGI